MSPRISSTFPFCSTPTYLFTVPVICRQGISLEVLTVSSDKRFSQNAAETTLRPAGDPLFSQQNLAAVSLILGMDDQNLQASASATTPSVSVTAPATTRAARNKRSWSGCARCKKRRQKCDEQRPGCGRCIAANEECVYEVKLRWGGRAFNQSRFGACISDAGVSKDKVKKLGK